MPSKVRPMSPEASERLKAIAEQFRGKELFPEAVARAKETLTGLLLPDVTRATDVPPVKLPGT